MKRLIIGAAALTCLSCLGLKSAFADSRVETNIGIVVLSYADMVETSVRCNFPMPPSVKASILTALLAIPDIDIARMELKIDNFVQPRITSAKLSSGECSASDRSFFDSSMNRFTRDMDRLREAIAEEN